MQNSWMVINIESKDKYEINAGDCINLKTIEFKKKMLSYLHKVRVDQIVLYNKDGEVLKDNKPIKDYPFKDQVVYYRIEDKLIKINIDMYQENIDKVVFYLSPTVSIFYIKMLLVEKTQFKVNENILFFGNKILRDDHVICEEIINNLKEDWMSYKPPSSKISPTEYSSAVTSASSPRNITLKLMKKKGHSNSLSFGLDFSFNHLKSLTKIKWNDDAPDYREVDDGMCLVCYCRNKRCQLSKEMFIQNLGKSLNLHKDTEFLK